MVRLKRYLVSKLASYGGVIRPRDQTVQSCVELTGPVVPFEFSKKKRRLPTNIGWLVV